MIPYEMEALITPVLHRLHLLIERIDTMDTHVMKLTQAVADLTDAVTALGDDLAVVLKNLTSGIDDEDLGAITAAEIQLAGVVTRVQALDASLKKTGGTGGTGFTGLTGVTGVTGLTGPFPQPTGTTGSLSAPAVTAAAVEAARVAAARSPAIPA
jgi:hypothetical protein